MTTKQLVYAIKGSPTLASYFTNWTTGESICPCCVKKIVEFSNQQESEAVVDTIVKTGRRHHEIETLIDELTRGFREELAETDRQLDQAVGRLYEIFNAR